MFAEQPEVFVYFYLSLYLTMKITLGLRITFSMETWHITILSQIENKHKYNTNK